MRPITTLCFLALVLCHSAIACSWVPSSFCGTSDLRPNDVVLSGKVVGVDMDGIDLEVIDVLRGMESRDTIRIWDGTDFDCNGLFSMAASNLGELNDSILVVLPLITEVENTWDVIGDYRRPDFFGHTTELRITNGVISGYVWGPAMTPIWQMAYQHLVSNWGEGPDVCAVFLSIGEGQHAAPFTAHLTDRMLNLSIPGNVGSGATVRIHASNGQELRALNGVAGRMQVDLSDLSAGIYHIVLMRRNGTPSWARVMKL